MPSGTPKNRRPCKGATKTGLPCRLQADADGLCATHSREPLLQCSASTPDGERCRSWAGPEGLCQGHNGTTPPEDRRCTAICTGGTTRPERKGERCTRWAAPGLNVCSKHGVSKKARAAGQRRVAEAKAEVKARKLMNTYGRKIETTAVEALLEEVKWTAGHVAWLRERVGELEQHELGWGTTRVKEGGHDGGVTQEAEINVLLKLYKEERTHLLRVCTTAISAGIEERRIRLAESQGSLVAEVIKKILGDLNLSTEQQAKVHEIVPRHLRALSA